MPTTVSVSSNYAGKVAGKIIAKMFAETNTISSGVITMLTDVGYKINLRKIETQNGRRRYTCGFVPDGAITLSEKVLEPIKFKDDFEICKEDFRKTWGDGDLGASAWNDGNMKETMDAILASKLADNAEDIDKVFWTGAKTNADEFDGFLTLFAADADVVDVTINAVTIANVLGELQKVILATPREIKDSGKAQLLVSPDIFEKYTMYLQSQGVVNGLGGNANTEATFGRYRLVAITGLPDNTIIVATKENLVFGTGAMSDFNEIRLVDSDEINLDGKVKGSMVYSGAVGYYYGSEIVYARATTPSV